MYTYSMNYIPGHVILPIILLEETVCLAQLFVKLVRNAIKSKFIYNDWGIAFDGGSRSFDNDYARNVVIFGVDNSYHLIGIIEKNNFLILGEGLT